MNNEFLAQVALNKAEREKSSSEPFAGQKWLVEERDACGVGFIAYQDARSSHQILEQALVGLGCMEHRGGCSADNDSGDGAGVMTAIPHLLLEEWFKEKNLAVPSRENYGVGMIFLPQDRDKRANCKDFVEAVIEQEGLLVAGWRIVPVDTQVLGAQAKEFQPHIEQVVVTSPKGLSGDDLDRKLYVARSRVGKKLSDDFYICSFSCRTIVYKGMVRSEILGEFYLDLKNPAFETNFAVYHRRFSTNTMPKWPFAQPMRLLGHNGEINTLLGNINWMATREQNLSASNWSESELEGLTPIVNTDNSDSYNLDSSMELLVKTGRSLPEAAMILVPEAYKNQPDLQQYPEIIDFYEYYSGLQEPWDGPALLVYSDGKTVGASLDRNGLRPARYTITKEGYIIVASETGVVEIPDSEVLEKGRLGPGQSIVVDLQSQEILRNWDIKKRIAQVHPYGEWVSQHRQTINAQDFSQELELSAGELLSQQAAFGYSAEDLDMIIQSMAVQGKEPTYCMGDDIPLAVLSSKAHLLYDYFKQRFAQVTNPPIDPLRESLVMSLEMKLGAKGNLLDVKPEDACLLKLESPVLNDAELSLIKDSFLIKSKAISTLYEIATGPQGLAQAIKKLCAQAVEAVNDGVEILILSDRTDNQIGIDYSYIPPLAAVGAVHHHLIKAGLRLQTSLVMSIPTLSRIHH